MDSVSLINKGKNKFFNIALIIIALVIAFNIYKKQVARLDSLKVTIAEEEKKNLTLNNIEKLNARINSYRQLLSKKESGSSINDINNIARNAGIKVTSIKPSGEDVFPDYTKYMFELTISSPDYDSLAKFINTLEVNQTVYMVDTLEIRSPSFNREKELNASLRVSAVAMLE